MEESRIGVCMICERQRTGGIRIISAFLCDECSSEMVKTDVRDKKYPFYVKQMKKVFRKQNARSFM